VSVSATPCFTDIRTGWYTRKLECAKLHLVMRSLCSPHAQCTLPFMSLDLIELTHHATGGVEPPLINKYWSAALMILMVFFGSVYRFFANQLRGKPLQNGEVVQSIDNTQFAVGVVSFATSCAIFVVVVANILQPIFDNAIDDPKLKHDADAVKVLTLTWIGYPLVSVLSRFRLPRYGYPKSAWVSTFKDVAYAVLDVVSKGGLAAYVCYRTTWLPL